MPTRPTLSNHGQTNLISFLFLSSISSAIRRIDENKAYIVANENAIAENENAIAENKNAIAENENAITGYETYLYFNNYLYKRPQYSGWRHLWEDF